jgi:hypothetical protein
VKTKVAWKYARRRQEELLPAAAEASQGCAERRRAAIFSVALRAELDVPQEAEPVALVRAAWARLVSAQVVKRVTEVFVESQEAAQKESLAASL